MKKPLILLLAVLAAAAIAVPAASAGALKGGVQLSPLTPGTLWKTGVLADATMYAQGGASTHVLVRDINVPGQLVVSQPVLNVYACNSTSKKVSPMKRATVAGGSSCQPIRRIKVVQGERLTIGVPTWATGRFLSIQESAELLRKGTILTGTTWLETAVYPQNPTAVRPPLPTTAPYAGLPVHYQPLPWKTASYTTHLAYQSEAWICPTKAPNTNPAPLSSQGCNRAYKDNVNGTGLTTFTLSGRVHRELTEWQYLYFVGYDIIDPNGPIGPSTYMNRSKATRIKPIPAPKVTVTVSGKTIKAQFAPLQGATYQMATFLNGKYGAVVGCTGVTVRTCTATVNYAGTWKVHVTPKGKLAVGTSAIRTVTVSGGLPQAPRS